MGKIEEAEDRYMKALKLQDKFMAENIHR